ncbi:hypothetical protein [Haliea sp.]|uniref:hypothetical protein n=1 Tax=Haliea sp. TaxID=1932666 RepID=UPI000C45875A|nr:hypothetical protein [Haliea sp.]MAY92209.1 hypothetical protein [Haliea sp.]MBK42133.1 hypothetical protein [Haliea sp.]MBP69807.1 hypothetical protein [Haliea sp.]|tara:strand:- start:8486 stop:9997 length:1512 start_codon:yes stop_codon:yes gene_type:complete
MEIQTSLHLLEGMQYELAHDDMRQPYIRLTYNGKKILLKVRGEEFKSFFKYQYNEANSNFPDAKLLKNTIAYLEGKAIYEGSMIKPDVRLTGSTSLLEIDLCDDSYLAVKISAEGFEVREPEGYLLRRHGQLPLPLPELMTPEEVLAAMQEFKAILNVSEEQFVLVMGVLLMGFHPAGPYPVLFVQGEYGSAKGSLCEAIKSVVDPNMTPHTALPANVADFLIQAMSNRVLSFDNLSDYTFNKKHSDLFAQMATGVGLRRRQLYTDDGECVFNVSRMILMNGIDDVVTQSDLGSRTIGLSLHRVDSANRISMEEFRRRLGRIRPRMFSAIVNILVQVLRNYHSTEIQSDARMFDMIQWVTAGENAMGWEPGTFQRAYELNQLEVMEAGLGSDPLAVAIIRFMEGKPCWNGSISRLLACLNAGTDRGSRSGAHWPRSAISLGRNLNRIETNLRALGIAVTREGRSASERTITIVNHNLSQPEIAENCISKVPDKGLLVSGSEAA